MFACICKHPASLTPNKELIGHLTVISSEKERQERIKEENKRPFLGADIQVGNMKLTLLTLVVFYMVGNISGMSTCKTLDLEMVKKKRIEAIRSQILSKLRLPKEPEQDQGGDDEEIPTALLSLYNSTKELLKEQTEVQKPISPEQEEMEYFAKMLHKFNISSEYR